MGHAPETYASLPRGLLSQKSMNDPVNADAGKAVIHDHMMLTIFKIIRRADEHQI
jgi:hypothetical protein